MSDCKITIFSFVRSVEPREPELDMLKPMVEQVSRLKKHSLPATFLFQYDALLEDRYVDLVRDEPLFEKGLWLETVQPLVEAIGLPWRGRYPWDWHAHCGFLVGYTPEERVRLIDEAFDLFKKRFGYFPTAVGSWMIDAYSLRYMEQKYHVRAATICREQWGMDGYSLWGGYFSQGYYPSDRNVLCPAQSEEHRISVPVFRKSNSDPVYDYDFDLDYEKQNAGLRVPLTTSEAACDHGGADPVWLDWTFKINHAPYATPFGFVDIGQENSFSWELQEKGIDLDYARAAELRAAGEADVLTISELGTWYQETFADTPACCLYADEDSKGVQRGSMWYQNRNYRVNLFFDEKSMWIRDMHMYDECYDERYLADVTTTNTFLYDNLPVVEGRLWSDNLHRAGMYICAEETGLPLVGKGKPQISECGEGGKDVVWETEKGQIVLELREDRLTLRTQNNGVFFKNTYLTTGEEPVPFVRAEEKALICKHNNHDYAVNVQAGSVAMGEDVRFFPDKNGVLTIQF